jgi:hypothetical protein
MNCDFQKIIRITQALNDFWLNSRGWAPESAYALIQEARLSSCFFLLLLRII